MGSGEEVGGAGGREGILCLVGKMNKKFEK